jgi:hypothetical protein
MKSFCFLMGICVMITAYACAAAAQNLPATPSVTQPFVTFTAKVYPTMTPSLTPVTTPTPTLTATPTPTPTQSIDQVSIQQQDAEQPPLQQAIDAQGSQDRLTVLKNALLLWTHVNCSNPPFSLSEVAAFIPVCGIECAWVARISASDGSNDRFFTVNSGDFEKQYPLPDPVAYRLSENLLPTELEVDFSGDGLALSFSDGYFVKIDGDGTIVEKMNKNTGKWGPVFRSAKYPKTGGIDMSQACFAEGCYVLADSVPWREGSGADILMEMILRAFASQRGIDPDYFYVLIERNPIQSVILYQADDTAPSLLTPKTAKIDFSKPVQIEFLEKRPTDGSAWTLDMEEQDGSYYWQGMKVVEGQLIFIQKQPIFSWYVKYKEGKGGFLPGRLMAQWQLIGSLNLLRYAEETTSASKRLVMRSFSAYSSQATYRDIACLFKREEVFGTAASPGEYEANSPVIFIPVLH